MGKLFLEIGELWSFQHLWLRSVDLGATTGHRFHKMVTYLALWSLAVTPEYWKSYFGWFRSRRNESSSLKIHKSFRMLEPLYRFCIVHRYIGVFCVFSLYFCRWCLDHLFLPGKSPVKLPTTPRSWIACAPKVAGAFSKSCSEAKQPLGRWSCCGPWALGGHFFGVIFCWSLLK